MHLKLCGVSETQAGLGGLSAEKNWVMQRISSYGEKDSGAVDAALRQLPDEDRGVRAEEFLMEGRWFARFTWPDWPKDAAEVMSREVDDFHRQHPQLRAIAKESEDWSSVSRGWEADYESAEAIAQAFGRHFDNKVAWVESERDRRGRIEAFCMIAGVGKFMCSLSWRNSLIQPLGSLSEDDRAAFSGAGRAVVKWAAGRVQPVLDELQGKLKELYGERFRGLYVFGSYARADAGIELPEGSDLDVALVLSDFGNAYDEITRCGEITSELSLEHSLVVSVVPIRESDYKEGRTNFIRVISEYAIPVK